jgi:hypothetical protein
MAVALAFAGPCLAQTTEVLRGTSTDPKKTQAKPAVHKVGVQTTQRSTPQSGQVRQPTTPQSLRGSRYGGFAPGPVEPIAPPVLDLTSPRSLSLVNVNTQETLTVTYWSDGTYRRDA